MLTGTGAALITPFHSNGEIDFPSLERTVNNIIKGRVEFLVVLGSTAETATLSPQEKEAVIQCIRVAAKGRVPLILGVGGNNTAETVQMLRTADLSPFSGILSVVPYYNKPSQEGIYAHFAAIAQACPLPVILYNIPARCGVNMTPETALRLANDFPNIQGIKESSGSMEQIMQLIKGRPEHFSVLAGDDPLGVPAVMMGAQGLISVMANIYPKDTSEMIRDAMRGRVNKALAMHYKYLDFISLLFREGNPTGIKTAMSLSALIPDTVRLPLVRGSQALRDEMSAFLKA